MEAALAGYPWLPRMIDKARAAHAGTLGDYFRYPCPIDEFCLSRLGIDAETFLAAAVETNSDDELLRRLRLLGIQPPEAAAFDPVALNLLLHRGGS